MSIGTYTPDTVVSGNVPDQVPNENGDPGSVNAPAVAEPSSAFTGGTAILLIAASGADAAYGGCEVHVSFDGTNYSKIGVIESSAPQGVLTGNLADHADPDTANTLSVDCVESFAAPPAGITHDDADNDRTLSLVCAQPSAGVLDNAGELLAFGAVSATGTYTADLTWLRRGQLGSAHAAHSSGDMFTVLDPLGESGTALRYDLPPQYIGTTIYLKFAAFNQFGNATQDLSLCTEYTYVPVGRGYDGTGGGTNTALIAASEDLTAGNIVDLHTVSGAVKMQKANATDASKPAHGFVLSAVASGASGILYGPGQIDTKLSGLTPGAVYWLDTTGGAVTSTPPTTSGNLVQEIGVALSASALLFFPKSSVQL